MFAFRFFRGSRKGHDAASRAIANKATRGRECATWGMNSEQPAYDPGTHLSQETQQARSRLSSTRLRLSPVWGDDRFLAAFSVSSLRKAWLAGSRCESMQQREIGKRLLMDLSISEWDRGGSQRVGEAKAGGKISEERGLLICHYEYPPADHNYWLAMVLITPFVLFLAYFAEDVAHQVIYVGVLVLFWISFLYQAFCQKAPDSLIKVNLDKRVFRFERFRFRPHPKSFFVPTFFRRVEQILVPFDDVRDLQLYVNTNNGGGLRSLSDRKYFQRIVTQLEKSDGKFDTGRARSRYLLLITSKGDLALPLYGLQNRHSLIKLFGFLKETSTKAPIGISPIFAAAIFLGIAWFVFAAIMLFLNWEQEGQRTLWTWLLAISCPLYVFVFIAAANEKRSRIRNEN